MRHPRHISGFAMLVFLAGGCAGAGKDARPEQIVSSKAVEPAATSVQVIESPVASADTQPSQSNGPLAYEVLRGPWMPYDAAQGLGLEILIPESATQDGIVRLLTELTVGKNPVTITVWTSRQAWEDAKRSIYGDLYDRHLICVHVKNTTVRRAFFGSNEIRWMQEKGGCEGQTLWPSAARH